MNTLGFVKSSILDFFRQQDIRDDHVLDLLRFQKQNTASWNLEQKSALEPAIVELIREGMLEKKQGYIVLTHRGFKLLYFSLTNEEKGGAFPATDQ